MKKLKEFLKNNFIYLFLALFAVSILFNLNQCKNATVLENTIVSNNEARNDTIDYFKNEVGQVVAEKKSFQTTIKEMDIYIDDILHENTQLEKTIKTFKKPTSASSVDIKVAVNDVDIKFENPVNHVFSRNFALNNPDYTFNGTVNQYGLKINFLASTRQTRATGDVSTGLFSKDFATHLVNSNPIFTPTDMTNIDFTEKKSRFRFSVFLGPVITPKFQLTIGAGAGLTYAF